MFEAPPGKNVKYDTFQVRKNVIKWMESVRKNAPKVLEVLPTKEYQVIDNFSDKYLFWLKNYYYTGGMPAVVDNFRQHKDYTEVRQLQKDIVRQYEGDFEKHIEAKVLPRIRMVWDSIPMQLAYWKEMKFSWNF